MITRILIALLLMIIPAQAQWLPSDIDVRAFGAATDGATDASQAIQTAINYARSYPNGGPTVVFGGGNDYVVDNTINAWSTVPLTLKWEAGSRLLCRMPGPDAICLKGTHPTNPQTRGGGLRLIDPRIEVHSDVRGIGPVLFEQRAATNLVFQGTGLFKQYHGNTAIRISSAWNCDFGPTSIWGAGYNWIYKDASKVTFSIVKGSTTLAASASIFDPADVGHAMVVDWGNGRQKFTITAVADPTHAMVAQTSAVNFVSKPGAYDGAKGSMAAGSNVLTLDAPVAVSSDLGRIVYVLGAAMPTNAGVSALRAKIIAVNSSTSVTLDTPAGVAVNGVYVVPSPGVEMFSLDGNQEKINDLEWLSFHIEQFSGTGLVVQGAINLRMYGPKIHAMNNVYDAKSSTFSAVLDSLFSATMSHVELDGTPHNDLAKIYVGGLLGMLSIQQVQGEATVDERFIWHDPGGPLSVISVSDWALIGDFLAGTWLDRTTTNALGGTGAGRYIQSGFVGLYTHWGL